MNKKILFLVIAVGVGSSAMMINGVNETSHEDYSHLLPKEGDSADNATKLNAADLAGRDNDNNGVRDDIDAYLQIKYKKASQLSAAKQYAAAMQKILIASPNKTNELVLAVNDKATATACVFEQFSDGNLPRATTVMQEVVEMTINTKPRMTAYTIISAKQDGISPILAPKKHCEVSGWRLTGIC